MYSLREEIQTSKTGIAKNLSLNLSLSTSREHQHKAIKQTMSAGFAGFSVYVLLAYWEKRERVSVCSSYVHFSYIPVGGL